MSLIRCDALTAPSTRSAAGLRSGDAAVAVVGAVAVVAVMAAGSRGEPAFSAGAPPPAAHRRETPRRVRSARLGRSAAIGVVGAAVVAVGHAIAVAVTVVAIGHAVAIFVVHRA